MKYSVIIPVYNKTDTIAESIKSILAQTEKDYEVIVVNDGSKDNLHEVLTAFPTIRLINQENGGVSVARNTGIHAAQGDFICFLDADDMWLPTHLEELSRLNKIYPDCEMLVTSHIETFQDGRITHSSRKLKNFPERFLCDNLFELLNTNAYNLINTNSVCINKNLIHTKKIYFEPGEKIGEDTDVWYRAALNTAVAISRNETTVYRRENSTATKNGSGSLTWIFARRWEQIENGDYREDRKVECRKLIERQMLTCSRDYMVLKDRSKAKKVLQGIRYHNKKYYLTLLLTKLPYSLSKWLITHR